MNEPKAPAPGGSQPMPMADAPHDDDVRAFLGRWAEPPPREAARAQTLAAMRAELAAHPPPPARHTLKGAWLVLAAQGRIVNPALLIASAWLIALGALVSALIGVPHQAGLPLAVVAPIVAAFGVALLYGLESDPAIELVSATPVSPRTVVLARLALVFGFDLALSLLASVVLALVRADFDLSGLVLLWLAPMTLLSGLAFAMSVLWFDPLLSGLLSLGLWAVLLARHFDITAGWNALAFIPDVFQPDLYAAMFAVGLAALGLALVRVRDDDERWARLAA